MIPACASTQTSIDKLEKPVFVMDLSKVSPSGQTRKLHLQIGHGSFDAVKRLVTLSGYSAGDIIIRQVIANCGCGLSRGAVQRPIARRYVPTRCCATVGLDIMYPVGNTGHSMPFLICVDHLSRYTIVARLKNHLPDYVSEVWFMCWMMPLGNPAKLIADRGPAFIGTSWANLADLLDFQYVLISREAPFENGTVERSVGLIKLAYHSIRRHPQTVTHEKAMTWAAISRNLTPKCK